MSPKKKAKPSPSSQSDTTIPTLFLDECFGSGIVLKGLRAAGYRVVSPSQSSEVVAGELDEEWLPKAEKNKWIVLTKDNAMRRRHLRTEGTNNYEIILFILRGKNMRGEDMLAALLSALPKIARRIGTHNRPLIGTISSSGNITILTGERRGAKKR